MNNEITICESCKNFAQHYRANKVSKRFTPVHCGHCIYPRIKHRKPNCKACEHYEENT